MLDLTRYAGQRIRIGDDIVVVIRSVSEHGRVFLSVEAPRDVPVHREEVYQRIRAEMEGRPTPPGLTSQYQRLRPESE